MKRAFGISDASLALSATQPEALVARGWKVPREREIPTNVVRARRGGWQVAVEYGGDAPPPRGVVLVDASVYEVDN